MYYLALPSKAFQKFPIRPRKLGLHKILTKMSTLSYCQKGVSAVGNRPVGNLRIPEGTGEFLIIYPEYTLK